MQRTSVDLPQPDSPTMPSVSPSRSVKETPSTAFTVATSFWKMIPCVIGKCFVRLSTTRNSSPVTRRHTTTPPVTLAEQRGGLALLRRRVEVARLRVRGVRDR